MKLTIGKDNDRLVLETLYAYRTQQDMTSTMQVRWMTHQIGNKRLSFEHGYDNIGQITWWYGPMHGATHCGIVLFCAGDEMAIDKKYQSDVDIILSHRHDLGADYWTTPDKRLAKGSPFSTYDCALMLLELGMEPTDPILQEVAALFFGAWRPDGRFKLTPSGGILPCHTARALYLLCHMGYQADVRIQRTFQYFLDTPYVDGGWRCNKFSYGRGPETEHSNPFPTLHILDAFRFSDYLNQEPSLDKAVEFLLAHWTIKRPIGPCQYGMGTRFMQVGYPLEDYNLFQYVYVLSFWDKAKKDTRFLEAFSALQDKLVDGKIVVERNVPKLAKLTFCKKGQPSELATKRYLEILANLS